MIGSILGDIAGSRFEFDNISHTNFNILHKDSVFTDDTVLTIATAKTILNDGDFLRAYQNSYYKYPNRGWGGMFQGLAGKGALQPYDSYGNGSAMRVSPCGWIRGGMDSVMYFAEKSAEVTHNHPEGIKGAKAVAGAIFMARNGATKKCIMDFVSNLGYDLSKKISDFTKDFDVTCQGTIPRCMAIFNESKGVEDSILKAVVMGGDCDTNACIVGGISEAYWGLCLSSWQESTIFQKLSNEMVEVIRDFKRNTAYDYSIDNGAIYHENNSSAVISSIMEWK